LTNAPLVIMDQVLMGMAGGELGIRGFLAADDARTRQMASIATGQALFPFGPRE
jgi:hypothetical protein